MISSVILLGLASTLHPVTAEITGPLGILLGLGYGGSLYLINARKLSGRDRVGWSLIGAGLLSGACGVVAVAILEMTSGPPPPFGPTDVFFIATYLLILSGLVVLPHTPGRWLQRMLVMVDGLVVAVSLATLAWIWFLGDLLHELESGESWNRVLGTAYPLLDVTYVIVGILLVTRRTSFRFDPRVILLSLALIAQAAADLLYLQSAAATSFTSGEPVFLLFTVAAAASATVGTFLHRVPQAREYPDRPLPWWTLITPYSAAGVMILVFLVRLSDEVTGEVVLLAYATLAVGGLAIARQAVAIRENRSRVERERRSFVSSLSHELRTPLTSMVGFLDVLRHDDGLSAGERDEMFGIVEDQTRYLNRIVSDLVTLAREDPSAMPIERSAVRLRQAVDLAVSSADIPSNAIVDRVPTDLVAQVDEQRMHQILVNLLRNAMRYGGGRILVLAKNDDCDLVLEVHDNGSGVPAKYQVVIWDRFERGPHRFDARTPGSGIGLAVVSAVAQAHDGAASYRDSELLGGACFSVRIPRCVCSGHEDRAFPHPRPSLVPNP